MQGMSGAHEQSVKNVKLTGGPHLAVQLSNRADVFFLSAFLFTGRIS
jgi:hypothetical protein